MMKIFEESTFWQRMRRMLAGFGKPKDSGEYKFAKLQLQRLSAPFLAVAIPVVLLCVLLAVQVTQEPPRVFGSPYVGEPTTAPPILEPLPEPPKDPFGGGITEGPIINFPESFPSSDSGLGIDNPFVPPEQPLPPTTGTWKGPVTIGGPLGIPDGGPRVDVINTYTNDPGEIAVMNALRWFVTKQNADGSWGEGGNRTAMTGLVLLCFLGHNETPSSREFGEVVRRGLMFLVDGILPDGTFAIKDGHNYSHAIATYALCEAYSMVRTPMLQEAAERTLVPIIAGQHRSGGWDYNLAQTDRADTSFMGWCAQAVKAGHVAGLDVPGLEKAYDMVAPGMRQNFGLAADRNRGGFGYVSPDPNHGLTAVGVLCMQLTDNAKAPEVKAGLNTMDTWTVGWDDTNFGTKSGAGQYYFYYATQCMFNHGGARWEKWERRMRPAYTKAQTVVPVTESGYVDHKKVAHPVGFWVFEVPPHVETGGIFDTALIALQIMVPYRFLPTTRAMGLIDANVLDVDEGDVKVNIRF